MTQLIKLADEVLVSSKIKSSGSNTIDKSYNGSAAAFGVTVLMSGLVPALVMYYQDAGEKSEINRRVILEAVGQMIRLDKQATAMIAGRPMNQSISGADTLLQAAVKSASNKSLLKQLSHEVIECATALKLIIRTYKLV